MSSTYRPGDVPSFTGDATSTLANLLQNIRDERFSLERALNEAMPYAELRPLAVEPARTRAGMLILADGTNLDPGSGEGLYRRNSANTAWVFLG